MNKTKILLISTGVLIALAIVTGISYAVWLLTAEQTDQNVLATECFDITFTENADSNINLQSTYPLLDSEGEELTPYTFSVTNTCDLNAKYQINLEVLNTTTLSHDLIKTKIDTKLPSIVTSNNIVTSTIANSTSYTIKTDYLAYNETNNHEFRMWIDESATLDNSQNKLVEAKIVISAEPIDDLPYDYNLEDPVLDSKMVPVLIEEGTGVVTIAANSNEWYNYNESKWANAVIVNPTFTTLEPGTTIPMESIEQMYVWIPRYEYKKSSIVNAQESIEINFVSKNKVNTNLEDDVIVHPAFTFDGVEQAGLWVGKFEMGFKDGESETTTNVEYIIKPNVNSVHSSYVNTMFDKINNAMDTYSMDATTDVHMMKNTEWGVVAYLSQSQYGICEDDVTCSVKIENNNYYNYYYDIVTGCGGNDTPIQTDAIGMELCPASNRWETTNGIKASTTHNITGIYDMAGGRFEYVMGNMVDSSGNFYSSQADFTTVPEVKYYDSYVNASDRGDYTRGLFGDATLELNLPGILLSNWNLDVAYFVHSNFSWFLRGCASYCDSDAGIWTFDRGTGGWSAYISSRSIILIY